MQGDNITKTVGDTETETECEDFGRNQKTNTKNETRLKPFTPAQTTVKMCETDDRRNYLVILKEKIKINK